MVALTVKAVWPLNRTFWKVRKLYLSAFPPHERLPMLSLFRKMFGGRADFLSYYADDKFIGFLYCLKGESLIFPLFLAVEPSYRSQGFGSEILRRLEEDYPDMISVLAIEPLEKSAANYQERLKRLAFYEKNGYELINYYYLENAERYQLLATSSHLSKQILENELRKMMKGIAEVKIEPVDAAD